MLPGRIIAALVEKTWFVSCYAPTFAAPEDRDSFFDVLASFVKTTGHTQLVCLGDFNARMRCQLPALSAALYQPLSRAIDQFEDFLDRCDMVAPQLTMPKPEHVYPTFRAVTLDYVLVRRRLASSIQNWNTLTPPVRSDHKMLIAIMKTKWKQPKERTQALPRDWSKVDTGPLILCDNYAVFVEALKEQEEQLPIQERARAPKRAWDNGAVQALATMQAMTKTQEVILLTTIDAVTQDGANNIVQNFVANVTKSPRLAWSFIKSMRKTKPRELIADTEADRLNKFHTHFSSLFAAPVAPEVVGFFTPQNKIIFKEGPFSSDELTGALEHVGNGKAAGLDGIRNETLRLPDLHNTVLSLLNQMLTGKIVEQQKTSIIVTIAKKGDMSLPANFRGVSLMSHLTKLYDKLLHGRISRALDEHLLPVQNGFRHDRGTSQHVAALIALKGMAETLQNFPLHLCFVDFAKAFDSVYHWAIRQALESWGMPSSLIAAVFRVMEGHVVRVRQGTTLGDPIAVGVGVLQGDTLAPLLFIIVVDGILRKLPYEKGLRLGPTCAVRQRLNFLCALAYADDITLISATPHGLQDIFASLERNAATVGLKVNYGKGKTERVTLGDGSAEEAPLKTAAGLEVPAVTSYRYLGTVLGLDNDIRARTSKCWGALKALDGIWHSNLPTSSKRDLFYTLVEPIWTTGLCCWPLSATMEAKLDGTFSRIASMHVSGCLLYTSPSPRD